MMWLVCETTIEGDKKVVEKLKCKVCTRSADKIMHRQNFSESCINGSDSAHTNSVHNHANNDHHKHTMSLLNKECATFSVLGPVSSSKNTKAFNKLPEDDRKRLKVKFDIAYSNAIYKAK